MKTKEFKIYPSDDQRSTIARWLETLRLVWNAGLEILIELETYSASYAVIRENGKKEYDRAPCCPIQWEYRWLKGRRWAWVDGSLEIVDGEPNDWAAIPFSPRTSTLKRRAPYRATCPLIPTLPENDWTEPSPFGYKTPRLDYPTDFSLAKYFAHKRHPNWSALKEVPAWFIRGTLHSLANSWQRYKAKKGGIPKFKRKGDNPTTLIYEDGKAISVQTEERNGRDAYLVRVPKLGYFHVHHMEKDWKQTPIKVLKLCCKPDGFYLQFTGELPSKPLKPSSRTAGLALPMKQGMLYVDDAGKTVEALPEDIKLLARLEKLQQKLSRQKYLSRNWKKTKAKIGRIHSLIARRGRNHNHKMSTFLIRKFGEVAIQEIKPGTLKHPDAIVADVEPAHYDPNGAKQVSQINQRRASLRTGQFVELSVQKAKAGGRTLTKVKSKKSPKDTTPVRIAASIKPSKG